MKKYNIFKTTNEMLIDRGYIVDSQKKTITFEQFKKLKFYDYITEKFHGDKIFLTFQEKLKKEDVKKIFNILKKHECKRCIVVLKDGSKVSYKVKHILTILLKIGYIYEVFWEKELVLNLTKHILVPKHYLLTKEQRERFLNGPPKMDIEKLPKIRMLDFQNRYHGGRPGDIFKIIRTSESTGFTPYYRKVI